MAVDPHDPYVTPDSDEAILQELNQRFDYAMLQWEPHVTRGNRDIRFVSGDTWDPEDRALRNGRLLLNLDQLGQYLNQLVNSVRQNKRAIKASPAGNGATNETASLRANRIREIEYQSHAQEAYTVAFENAATRSYGFARIVAEYEDSTSDNQVLRIKSIPNPNQVIPDPDAESTSGSDWQYLFFVHAVSKSEFRRDYPDAEITDFSPELIATAPRWFRGQDRIQIAEYWRVTETPSAKGGRLKREVCQYLTNGVELLAARGKPKKTVWKGSTIPFMSCYGKILYQTTAGGDAEKILQSYVRLALDAAKYYNWIKSTEGEVLSMVPKSALFAYEGQLSVDNLALVERSTYEPVPVIFARAQTPQTGQALLPLPQRNLPDPPIQAYEIAAESARRDVQNALGRYSASDHRLGSTKVTSGVALRELDKSGDLGSYHFIDHYDDFIRETGAKLDELLPFYDDTPKEIAVRLPDGSTDMKWVNRPTARGADGRPAFGPDDLRMDQGRHVITISTGPSFDSEREVAKDLAMTLLANPQAFPIVAADAVRLMQAGPIGDQMAEDLEFLQPPVMQQAKSQKDGKADPRQLQQENAQLKERVSHAEAAMGELHQQAAGKQAEVASRERIAAAEISSKEKIADLESRRRAETAIAVAEIGAKVKDAALFYEERARLGVQGHEADQAERDRQHEAALAAAEAAHAADQGMQSHQQMLEAGQIGHEQTLEQQQAAAPPNEDLA